MASRTSCLFIFALIYSAHCNPLGQTTLCESTQSYPNGATTVCESTPNLPYYPYGLPLAGMGSAGVLPGFLGALGLNGLPYPGLGSTTICENMPNIVGLSGMGGLGGLGGVGGLGLNQLSSLYGLPLGWPYCLPNFGAPNLMGVKPLGVPVPSLPAVTTGTSTVCESTPNLVGVNSLPLPIGGLRLGALGLGLGQAAVPFL